MNAPAIEILLWGQSVGYLAYIDNRIVFEYEESFKKSALEISPLELPLATTLRYSSEMNGSTFKGLPGIFADGLPDVYGNKVIDNFFFKTQGLAPKEVTPLMRLSYIHRRAIGALEYTPHAPQEEVEGSLYNIATLVDAAKKTLSGEGASIAQNIMQVGSSAGGLRAKAVIDYNPNTQEIKAGFKETHDGFKPSIIKFDGAIEGEECGLYGKLEYIYNLMACDCGIEVPDCHLLKSPSDDPSENSNAYHFITERFDRNEAKEKLFHQATFCGLTLRDFRQRNSASYEDLLRTVHGLSSKGMADVEEAMRRCIFNVILKNEDDHTKNFSFLMDQQGNWKLSPAYDLNFVRVKNGHQMSINGKNQDITKEDLLALGKYIGIKERKTKAIIQEVTSTAQQFLYYCEKHELPRDFAQGIARHFVSL